MQLALNSNTYFSLILFVTGLVFVLDFVLNFDWDSIFEAVEKALLKYINGMTGYKQICNKTVVKEIDMPSMENLMKMLNGNATITITKN